MDICVIEGHIYTRAILPCPFSTCKFHYLFVLYNFIVKNVLVEKPQNISMSAWDDEVVFPCAAETDNNTPINITWYFDDAEIDPTNKA